MPLDINILKNKLSAIIDPREASGYPSSFEQSASLWADAIYLYSVKIVPVSTLASKARVSFYNTFLTGKANIIPVLPIAFTKYAIDLAAGMSHTFTGVPPPNPIVLDPAFAAGMAGADASIVVNNLVTIIHSWFITGTATNIASGITSIWS